MLPKGTHVVPESVVGTINAQLPCSAHLNRRIHPPIDHIRDLWADSQYAGQSDGYGSGDDGSEQDDQQGGR